MRTYTDAFIYGDDVEFRLSDLQTGNWVLSIDNLNIFMTGEQVKQLVSTVGQKYWDLGVPDVRDMEEPSEELVW